MASRTIKVPFSVDGLTKLANNFQKYTDNIIRKNQYFVERLATLGIPVIDAKIAESQGDSEKGHSTHIEIQGLGQSTCMAKLVVNNKDILFIEFGAGIHFNNAKKNNPKAAELGYGVGSYPGQTHAFNEKGWYYTNGAGSAIHSFGTEATEPLQSAVVEIISRIEEIAREVFSDVGN